VLIAAAILAIFVYGLIAAMLGTLLPELSTRFALTPGQNADIALAQAIGLIIASIAVGPLIDIKGKKTGLLLGMGLIAASLFVVPRAPGAALAPVFLALGVGGGIIVTAANALVSDISEARRASTLNLLNLFFGLGGLVTPLIAAYLLAGNTIALCYLVAVLAVLTFGLHVITRMPPPTGERGFKVSEIGGVLGRPVLYLLALLMFLYVACEVGVWNWLPRHLVAQGIPKSRALGILSLGFALGLLVGRVAVSRVLIKISSPAVTLAASVLMAVTTYAMLQTRDAYMAGILVFCGGLAMAPVFPTTLAMVGDAFPKMTATAMGVVITCGWTGLAVSSHIIGSIAGNDASQLKRALLIIPIASVIMAFVTLGIRPMLARRRA
jgi:fucose permease